jgi:hypothetical protein
MEAVLTVIMVATIPGDIVAGVTQAGEVILTTVAFTDPVGMAVAGVAVGPITGTTTTITITLLS